MVAVQVEALAGLGVCLEMIADVQLDLSMDSLIIRTEEILVLTTNVRVLLLVTEVAFLLMIVW